MDILFLSPADWSGPRGRFQHLAEGMARGNRVLYFDGLGVRTVGTRDTRRVISKVIRFLRPKPSRPVENLELFTVAPLAIPGQSRGWIRNINRRLLHAFIRQWTRRLRFSNPIVWLSYPHPDLVAEAERIERRALIYDCVDAWDEFGRGYENLESAERSLIESADLVFATAESLRERAARRNPRSFLIPNGVDLAAYRRALENPVPPADLQRIPAPRIGFVGNIAEWVDLDMIEQIARNRPMWNFVLIGPWLADRAPPSAANIHWLGPRSYRQVPHYLIALDACIIPFHQNQLTRSVDPLKLYEYLAAGRPVVTTPLPAASLTAVSVRIARTAEEFESALEEVLKAESSWKQASLAAVEPHGWSERMAAITEILNRELGIDLRAGGDGS